MTEEFTKRGWHYRFQSPTTNTKDQFIFPALSKRVSRAQVLQSGTCVLSKEEIWQHANAAWDGFDEGYIARAFMSHHQVVNAIIASEGDNGYLTEQGGLHMNTRSVYTQTPGGVQRLDETSSSLEAAAKLRYDAPAYVPSEVEHLTEIEKTSLQRWREEQQQHVSHGGGVVTGASGMSRNGRQRTPARRGID